jgi:tRNA threonylcarbamoyl adenosine modification protein (Sua5/YciO/YrdC/YwlC family)
MSARYDCTDPAQRVTGLAEAAASLRKGDLAVIPTDTVYGLAADAFSPPAVTGLLAAKGRDRQMPPPVLVGTVRAATALVEDLNAFGKDLIDEFWPGGLTLVMRANRSLIWDLGDTKGTVAVRMPLHELALELLKQTGPLAVSSANRSGAPPATTAADAEAQLGEAVAVYLDGGPCSGDVPSTIVDLTGAVPKLLRRGVISIARLREVVTLAVDDEWMEDDSGAVADGTMTDGTMTDGTAADGTAADGTAADGTVTAGTVTDGAAADGAAADGTAPGGTAPGGAAAGSTAAE